MDSVKSQHGIEISLEDIHVTKEEIRIYLNVANEWDFAFVPGFQHTQLRIDHEGNVLSGVGANASGMGGLGHYPLGYGCDYGFLICLDFSAGTNKQIMYLFIDPFASSIVGGDIETFKVIFETEEDSLAYSSGVRDFIWEISVDANGNLTENILTEDLSDLPVLKMRIREIIDSYEENQFAFEINYKGRKFEITGIIQEIGRAWDTELPVIWLGPDYSTSFPCHFTDPKQIIALTKGDWVTFSGTYADGYLKLFYCELVD